MYALTTSVLILCAAIAVSGFALGPQDVVLHVFTRNNPSQSEALWPTQDSLWNSVQFSPNRRTVITIHNFGESISGNFNAFVIPGHLQAEDVNIIAVDWSRGSSLYAIGLGNAAQLGQIIATFVNYIIHDISYPADQIRIVGLGLGGHIAGIVARNIDGNVPHIIALDPSLHGWTHNPDILSRDDADVVEVIHTTSGIMGYDLPLGDVDFYPNGGTMQAGCTTAQCSHTYAYAFYAESLTAEVNNGQSFLGTACESYQQAITLNCDGERDLVFGGTVVKRDVHGIYSFITNFTPPFARG